ncbi:hypothetical protein QYM36_002081, partial [Artemia franciscana]
KIYEVKMHEAYECKTVLQKLPLHIESIDAYDEKLVVGTRQGNLLIYEVKSNGIGLEESDSSVQLVKSNKFFSKKPIIQVKVVPEQEILISLSDGVVNVHDLGGASMPLISSVKNSKGALVFSTNINTEISLTGEKAAVIRLVVAVKRKLQLYYWKSREFKELGPELLLPDTPRSIEWNDESICVGIRGEYLLLRTNGDKKELFFTGRIPEPTVSSLSDGRFVLSKDDMSIFVGPDGISFEEKVKWKEPPSSVVEDSPYLVGVLPDSLEVHSFEPWIQIQSVEAIKVKHLCSVTGKRGVLFAASPSQIWRLTSIPVHVQLPALMSEKLFGLATKLATMSDEPPEVLKNQIQRIQSIQAFDFFCQRNFKDAMTLFLQLETDPSHVIGLYPDLLPESYRSKIQYPEELPFLQGKDLENALAALIEYLTEIRRSLQGNVKSLSGPSPGSEGTHGVKTKKQLLQIIDTTLLKCYLKTNDALIASLLRLKDNYCHLEETEQVLIRYSKWGELVILYQNKGLHRKALELLKEQALKSPDLPLGNHMRTVSYLQQLGCENLDLILEFSDWVLCAHPSEGLKIFTEDVQEVEYLPRGKILDYLMRLHPHLVLPYLEHVIYSWEDTSTLFHNKLAIGYIDRITRLAIGNQPGFLSDFVGLSPIPDSEEFKSMCSSPSSVTSLTSASDSSPLIEYKRRFQFLIETSSYCSWEAVLTHIPKDVLQEERAFILGRLGRHKEALSIFVNTLNDLQGAEKYCSREYVASSNGKDVYVILLKFLLDLKDGSDGQSYLEEALRLVDSAGHRIRPEMALSLLPDGVPVEHLREYLIQALNSCGSERNLMTLLRGLLQADFLVLKHQKSSIESTKIFLKETNLCCLCQKKFTNQSAFVRLPKGLLMHYSCHQQSIQQ